MKPVEKAKLIQDYKRLIESEAGKNAKFVPLSIVLSEAYKIADKSADTWNPAQGAFSTHLTNQLKKLSRISTRYGATARLPENKQFKMQKINTAMDSLHYDLGRDPTADELAEATGMSLQEVTNLLRSRRKDVSISNLAYTPVFIENGNDEWVHFVYHDLTPQDKLIFEYKTGFSGKPVLSNEDISKKLNISISTINNRVKMISEKIAEGWQE